MLQSKLGNCWLMAALSAVAEYTQGKDDNADIGNLFITKEYYPGEPVEVQLFHVDLKNADNSILEPMVFSVADQFLTDGEGGFTVDVQGPDDLWVLFLEAAFAMMAAGQDAIDTDCYAAINGGFPHIGIMGLVGTKNVDVFTVDPDSGTTVVRNLESGQEAEASKEEVWEMLQAAEQAAELLVCAINDAHGDGTRNGYMGLVEGHAYSIKEVFTNDDGVQVVKVRNPWGKHPTDKEMELTQLALVCYGDEDCTNAGMCDFDFDTFLEHHHQIWVVNRHREGSCLDYLAQGVEGYKSGAAGAPWGEDDEAQEASEGEGGEETVYEEEGEGGEDEGEPAEEEEEVVEGEEEAEGVEEEWAGEEGREEVVEGEEEEGVADWEEEEV